VVTSLALLCGVFVVVGLLLAGSGLRRQPVAPPRFQRSPSERFGRHLDLPSPERVALIAGAFVGVLLLTRWPVAAIAAAVAALAASSPALRQQTADAEKAEALTVWAEMLRDATGTPRGIEGVLVATANGAPLLIRPHVVRLARRLPYEPLDEALDGLATDLRHPVGDLVVTALRLAARSGGRQIRAVLDDLATVAREEARMHRRVEVARARPRSDMRAVLIIMLGFVTLFILAARAYLEPYGTPAGQLVLCLVFLCWGAGVWAMSRLGRARPIERFLPDTAVGSAEEVPS
jgi:Flp pilus assembly protein TadB